MRATSRSGLTAIAITLAAFGVGCLSDIYAGQSRYYDGDDGTSYSTPDPPSPMGGAAAPEFGPTVHLADPPPPISGGTLTLTKDGSVAIAADPDRDAVYVVEIATRTVRTIHLDAHDEPGRVVLDGSGRAHVVLRRGGALATINVAAATVQARRTVCPLPRGVAWNAATDVVHVVCAGGELVGLPAAGGAAIARADVMDDLRDVVVAKDGSLLVTTFRRAEVLTLDPSDFSIKSVAAPEAGVAESRVAWRMISAPPNATSGTGMGEVVIVAQSAPDELVPTPPAYYNGAGSSPGSCSPTGPVTLLRYGDSKTIVPNAVLPVDVAVAGSLAAIVAAANGHTPTLGTIHLVPLAPSSEEPFGCARDVGIRVKGQITSVAFLPDGNTLAALSREPAALYLISISQRSVIRTIDLAASKREDTGHAIFHANSGAGIACASCHPEGRDDAHVWRSISEGGLRTPSLLGTVRGTAPYHWRGEAADMHALANLTFASRMRGPSLTTDRTDALGDWLGALPPLTATVRDLASVSRGQEIFTGAGKCASCHAGAARTNNATVDVGTGGTFQVPSLVNVGFRAPYLHDGSAPRIQSIPFATHAAATLSGSQLDDLTAYLRTF